METREELKYAQDDERLKQTLQDQEYYSLAMVCEESELITKDEFENDCLEKFELINLLMDEQQAIPDSWKD